MFCGRLIFEKVGNFEVVKHQNLRKVDKKRIVVKHS